MVKKQVAIIGMGVSGLAVLLALSQLPDKLLEKIDITCFDDPKHFGRGIPFQEDSSTAWINSPIDAISYDYHDMNDFQNWMEQKGLDTDQSYVPRSLYGRYMTERAHDLLQKLKASVIHEKVTQLNYEPDSQKWNIGTSQRTIPTRFDEVHLTCGELPVLDPYHLQGNPNYIADPYPLKNLPKQPGKKDRIAIIGTGLAAIDTLKWLLKNSQADLLAFSPSMTFPTVRILKKETIDWQFLTDTNKQKLFEENSFNFKNLEDLFLSELQALGFQNWEETCRQFLAEGIPGISLSLAFPAQLFLLQQLASHLVDWLTDFWPQMTLSDRQYYKENYGKAIINLRNPMPEEAGRLLIEATAQGRLQIIEAVTDIEAGNYGFVLKREVGKELSVATVINATGYHLKESNVHQARTLIQQVIRDGLVQIDPEGGLSILPQTGQVISPKYGILATLYAHGSLVNGVIYQNNSTIKIQQMAERAIRNVIKKPTI